MQSKTLPELKFKILIIGDSIVGKTSMLLKYVDNRFPETHIATIGAEYKIKTLTTDKYKINLNIWDTAGQERFRAITKSFFNNANGIIFVYDITDKKTFDNVKNWIKDSEYYGQFESVLCGNKVDLEKEKRQVKFDTLKEFGLKKKMEVFETSAKDGTNLEQAFQKLADLIVKSKSEDDLIREFEVKSSQNLNLARRANSHKEGKICCK